MSLKRVNFSPLHTFSRASDKTAIDNASGLLVTVPANKPAFSYSSLFGGRKPITIHEARTNIATRNKADANALATWAKINVTVATVADPQFGNVIELTDDAVDDQHRVALDGAADSVVRTRSVYVKAPATNAIPYAVISSRPTVLIDSLNLVINLATGEYSSVGASVTPIIVEPLGDSGWYRIGLYAAANDFSTRAFTIGMSESPLGTSTLYAGTGKKLLIALPQWETGTFATPPIETEAVSVTRAADVCTIDDLQSKPWWNANEGTLIFEVSDVADAVAGSTSVGRLLFISEGTEVSNSFGFNVIGSTGGIVVLFNDGINPRVSTPEIVNTSVGRIKIALTWRFGDFYAVSANGGEPIILSLAGTLPLTNSSLWIGSRGGVGTIASAAFNSVIYEPRAVSDAQLQEWSTI